MLNRENLHPYQKHCVEHIIKHEASALFLDMGLGKTISTLTAVNQLINEEFAVDKVLIIAPKRVAEHTWTDELNKWKHISSLKAVKILGNEKQRRASADSDDADLYIINRENVAWLVANYISVWKWDCIVIDELSSFKNAKSQRFKALKMARAKTNRIVGLTGTPAPNSLIDLWAQMYLIDKGERLGKSITQYRRNYFDEGKRNSQIVFNYIPRKGSEQKIKNQIKDICISMTKEDYLSLPPCTVRDVEVHLTDAEKDRYEVFERTQVMEIALGEEINAVNAAALSNKLQQYANGAIYDDDRNVVEMHKAKLEALKEIVDVATSPVLIAYSYKHDRDRILECLKAYKPEEFDSPDTLERWNRGEIKVLVGHPASMGHGLNIQAGGNTIVWFSMTWSLELYMQFNARLHRQGQADRVIIHRLITQGTIDERIAKSLSGKKATQDGIMEAVKAIIDKYKTR